MCGIAGILDLAGKRTAPEGAIEAMEQAIEAGAPGVPQPGLDDLRGGLGRRRVDVEAQHLAEVALGILAAI